MFYRFSFSALDSHWLLGFLTFLFLDLHNLFMARDIPLLFFLELLLFDFSQCYTSLVFLIVLLEIVNILDEFLGTFLILL